MDLKKKAIDIVNKVRRGDRASATFFIKEIFEDFIELHGDRKFSDDPAMITGIGLLDDIPVTIIAQERGNDTSSRIYRNFGSSHPEGYRKALRQMKLSEKFNRPIICFIDTSGAFCGVEAEERGQGEAIASCLLELSDIRVPVISIVIGEGGSGGALALALSDELWMMENSFYSVISPEGCASILFKNLNNVAQVAEYLKFTPKDLLDFEVCSEIIPHDSDLNMAKYIKKRLKDTLDKLKDVDMESLTKIRYDKIRKIGIYEE